MRGSWSNLLFLILAALGIIGLVSLIWLHPAVLLKQILIGGLIILGIYVVYRMIANQSTSKDEAKAYRRAVKQSKKRKKSFMRDRHRSTSKLTVIPSKSFKKRRPPLDRLKQKGHGHLTVIEGKKKKRKKGFL